MKSAFLTGPRIFLRPLDDGDVPQLTQWINDPALTRSMLVYQPRSESAEREFLAAMEKSEHEFVLGICLGEGEQLIGMTGLHDFDWRNRHASFGIFIGDRKEWGKGYATEATRLMTGHAFETLNLNRVWLHVYESNLAGIRAYEKVGYLREGVLRQDSYREGKYQDTFAMAMLREEWFAKKAKP